MIEINPSPVEKIRFQDKNYYVKRDDLLHKHFSGNKARKFHYFLQHDFPKIKKLISHGSAQSNALYTLSVLAKMRGWEFEYYCKHIASYLLENPQGNYLGALENGTQFNIADLPSHHEEEILFIPEGGAMKASQVGIKSLADEINKHFCDQTIDIFLPSGTGTTALYLQKYTHFQVYTTPCVGDADYLQKQFEALEGRLERYPIILNTRKKFHFGKLYREFFEIWIKLKEESGLVFDLLYDPKGWLSILEHQERFKHDLLYIHQGGLLGNQSMLKRYGRKFHEDFKK